MFRHHLVRMTKKALEEGVEGVKTMNMKLITKESSSQMGDRTMKKKKWKKISNRNNLPRGVVRRNRYPSRKENYSRKEDCSREENRSRWEDRSREENRSRWEESSRRRITHGERVLT